MPRMNCYSARPGSIVHIFDKTWKILENNTLECYLILGEINNLTHRKRIRYTPGQEIFLRWVPHNRI